MPLRPYHLLALAASVVASALVGCATPMPMPSDGDAVAVPAAWTAAAGSATPAPLAAWWRRFDDPLLSQLVGDALQHNTSVQAAQAALRQARALRDVAAAGALPTLGGSLSAQRARSGGDTGNRFQAGLDASWEPDVFGGTRAAIDAATAAVGSRAASLGDVQVSISAELALAYIDLRGTQARRAIADANLASQQETLQIAQWRQQAGLVTVLDTEQARGAVETLRAQLPALQTQAEQDAHAIAVLTGRPPAELLAHLSQPGALPQATAALSFSLPAETLRQRPDVRTAELDLAAALARVTQADAARMPSFHLGGSLGLSALTLGGLSAGSAVAASLLGSITLPVFDGGAGRASVRAEQAAYQQARAAWQASVLAALQDVENALVALRADRERVARLLLAADAADSAAQLARQRYASGLIDFQVVLDTQRSQLSTQDSVAGAQAAVSADQVRLFKALGGGWTPDERQASAATPDPETRR